MKKGLLTMAGVLLTVSLVSAGTTVPVLADEETTLVYGSGDYTRINPAMDEHGEINILIFNGLTAHDGDNQVVPGLAESWDFDDETNTYTFHMAEDAKWQDGEPVTAEDVRLIYRSSLTDSWCLALDWPEFFCINRACSVNWLSQCIYNTSNHGVAYRYRHDLACTLYGLTLTNVLI